MSYRDNYDRRRPARKVQMPSKRPCHVSVEPKGNEPIERTIKRFLRKVKKSGIADDYKKNNHYEKPSVKRRKDKMRRQAVLRKLKMKKSKENR